MNEPTFIASLICLILSILTVHTSCFTLRTTKSPKYSSSACYFTKDDNDNELSTFDFSNSDTSSKTIVSTLTNIVNGLMTNKKPNNSETDVIVQAKQQPAPSTPSDLLKFIEDDYIKNNYLWTGDIYLPAFESDCQFTDPTLSFTGLDTYVTNIQNLRPILNVVLGSSDYNNCYSKLLSIELNESEQYVQTRWNMVGTLEGLFWKPTIDVIGRTKFWFKKTSIEEGSNHGVAKVFFYDESWEISTAKALMQILTPCGYGDKK